MLKSESQFRRDLTMESGPEAFAQAEQNDLSAKRCENPVALKLKRAFIIITAYALYILYKRLYQRNTHWTATIWVALLIAFLVAMVSRICIFAADEHLPITRAIEQEKLQMLD